MPRPRVLLRKRAMRHARMARRALKKAMMHLSKESRLKAKARMGIGTRAKMAMG